MANSFSILKKPFAIAFLVLLAAACLFSAAAFFWSRHELSMALFQTDPENLENLPDVSASAIRSGQAVFRKNCAACHGANAHGDPAIGAPNLTDRDFLYGDGHVTEIEQTIRYGIRSGNSRGWDLASMPAYATPHPYSKYEIPSLSPADVDDLTAYIRRISHQDAELAAAERGRTKYRDKGCWDCHTMDAGGDSAIGAPNLTDSIWLHGDGSAKSIKNSISYGRGGQMPVFNTQLTPLETRTVALYVASLSRAGEKKTQ